MEELLALVEGVAAEPDRIRVLRHVGGCEACRRDLDLLRTAAGAARDLERRRIPLLAVAASVALLVGAVAVWQIALRSPSAPDVMRGALGSVVLIAPRGELTSGEGARFVWRAVPGAIRYELELLDGQGESRLAVATRDTVVALPDTVALVAGVPYRWWVRAVATDGAVRRSVAERFRIQAP